jgi:hypothetical protein
MVSWEARKPETTGARENGGETLRSRRHCRCSHRHGLTPPDVSSEDDAEKRADQREKCDRKHCAGPYRRAIADRGQGDGGYRDDGDEASDGKAARMNHSLADRRSLSSSTGSRVRPKSDHGGHGRRRGKHVDAVAERQSVFHQATFGRGPGNCNCNFVCPPWICRHGNQFRAHRTLDRAPPTPIHATKQGDSVARMGLLG